MTTPPAPAGWYPDGTVLRYWDGRMWTSHTAPLAPPAYAGPVDAPVDGPVAAPVAGPVVAPVSAPVGQRNPWTRKRVLLPAAALALLTLFGVLGSIGGAASTSTTSTSDPVALSGGAPAADPGAPAQAAAEKAAAEKAAADEAAA
ncbi:DUF2510 domain-containing protein, partial [Lapillicoccus jejuensis]